jgi:putative ABC transport system permease protein
MAFLRVFFRLIVRPLRQEPLRTMLTAFAVALGVAVVLAIEMAGSAAAGSFRSSLETLTGDADFEVTAAGGVPARIVGLLATLPYPIHVTPRIEGYASAAGTGRIVPLIGLDLLKEDPKGSTARDTLESLRRDNSVWVGASLAQRPGRKIRLLVNDRVRDYVVRGILSNRPGSMEANQTVVMDIAQAERVLRRDGRIDRILIQTPQNSDIPMWEELLRKKLPAGVDLEPFGARTRENRRMLAAFRWNLRVLSYIALIVGAFLIYNTISVSVVRRRAEIGVLRALGATRGGVLAAFLSEAVFFGLIGAVFGLALGRAMAEGAVRLMAATVESLYISSQPSPISISVETVVLALCIAVGVAIVSAFSPAREAANVPPVESMARGLSEYQTRVHKTRNLLLAALLAVVAAAASRMPPVDHKPLFGYVAAFLLVAASALAIPAMVAMISALSSQLLRRIFGVEALLASRSLTGSLRRTSVLIGALATAVAMMTSVGIMVGSFRETVQLWMENQFRADLYLRPAGPAAADRHPTMPAEIGRRLASLPGVAAVDRFRAYTISYDGLPVTLGAGESRVVARSGRLKFLSGDRDAILSKLPQGDYVIVSEPFANKHRLRAGDAVTLPLGGQRKSFEILGVYYDYANERGYIIMDRATLLKYLPNPDPTNIAVYLNSGANAGEMRREIDRIIAGRNIAVIANRNLKAQAIRIFDRTFAITYALEAVAVMVAVMGIAGALLAVVIDRRREVGVLRFLGASRPQVRRVILFEAGLLGLLANIAGLVLGFFLSLILIYVINKQSFGWTIQFHWPVAVLFGALSAVYVATLLAGLYPARVATRLNPIEVVHEE